MTKKSITPITQPPPTSKKTAKDDRAERLAAQLRANLKKRKAQKRARNASDQET
jgi:hypothetical protein